MKPAWTTQSSEGRYAQHWCHETDGPHCWSETISAFRPWSQLAARREREKKKNHVQLLLFRIFPRNCVIYYSFFYDSIKRTKLNNSAPASLKYTSTSEVKTQTLCLVEIIDFPYLPYIGKKHKALRPDLCYITLFNKQQDWRFLPVRVMVSQLFTH